MTRRALIRPTFLLSAFFLSAAFAPSLRAATRPDWTINHAPFRIVGNLFYVGSNDLAAYLITTPDGNILINSNLTSSPAQIRHNVEALGFRFTDIKILLISHAHFDHAAGSAQIKRLTHAQYEVMDGDAQVVETGGRADFFYGGKDSYPPAKVDRILHDGDEVRLGGTVLVAHLTPGHTKGCTTWTLKVADASKTYNVVIIGSTTILTGYRLAGDPKYPRMAEDFARTFQTLQALPCDIFLGAHGGYFDLNAKYAQLTSGSSASPNPFIDPQGYRTFVQEQTQAYRGDLAKQTTHPLK